MNTNLDKIALDLYGKIQTRFTNIKMGDEHAAVLSKKEDIPKARFFEFQYKENGVSLGTIAITLDEDDGVVVQISGDLARDKHHGAFKFIRSFRQFAKDRLLNFDVQNIGKSELDKRDYEFQSKSKEEPEMPQPTQQPTQQPKPKMAPKSSMMENKMYGTSKMSYQDLGEATLIVKHSQPINPDIAAGRTMHIEGIWVENADGERFKYPYKHLNGARALAEHLKAGGNPYDDIGRHITSLSEELAQLRKFKGYVSRNEALSEAMEDITPKVFERIEEVKKEIHNLQRPTYYKAFAESFESNEEQMIPEEVMSDWIDRLTVRTFNEELKTAFPYIFRLVDESEIPTKEINPDDLLDEAGSPAQQAAIAINMKKYGKKPKNMKESPEDQFENFINKIVEDEEMQNGENTLFSPNKSTQQSAIDKFNEIMKTELKGGPEGINIIDSLKGLIDDPEFLDKLKTIDPELDARGAIQQELNSMAETDIDVARILPQLDFKGDEQIGGEELPPAPEATPTPPPAPDATGAPPAPAAPPLAAPAPAAPPVAESKAKAGMIKAIHNAKKAGAKLDTKIDFGHKEMTLHDCIEECGMDPKDFGFDSHSEENGVQQILKSIAGFWNKEQKNFTIGGTRAKISIEKDFKNGEFPNATEQDLMHVIKLIDKADPSTHGHELGHIKHLAGVNPQTHSVEIETDEGTEEDDFGKMFAQFKQQHPQADMTELMQTVGSQGSMQMPGMGGAGMPDMNKMMGGIKMPQMPTMPQGGGNSITVNGKPASQAEFDAFTKQHNVIPGQMQGGQKLTPGQLPSLPGGMKTPQLGGNPQDMVNNMMKGMNENAELTAMLKIAGLR